MSTRTLSGDIAKTIKNGVFLDSPKILEDDEAYGGDNYFQSITDGGKYKGRQYMLPIAFTPMVNIASKTALERVGFNAANVTDTFP